MKLEDVDRTVYQNLRVKLVLDQLIVDVTTVADPAAYMIARRDLAAANGLGLVSELFGVGAPKKRDTKSNSKITIDRKDARPGTVGGSPAIRFIPRDVDGTIVFDKYKLWDQTYNFVYEIRTMSETAEMDRRIQETIDRVFGVRRYIKSWDDATQLFLTTEESMLFVKLQNSVQVASVDDFIERVIRIEIDDVFISNMELLQAAIPEMSSVTMNIEGLVEFPNMTVQQFVDVHALSCPNLNDLVVGITYEQIRDCLLTRIDFSDTNTQNHFTDGQIAQIIAWLGTLTPPDEEPPPSDLYFAHAIGL